MIFASDQYPELEEIIKRKFSQPGDVSKAMELVLSSNGLSETRLLTEKYCEAALFYVSGLRDSDEKTQLLELPKQIMERSF